MELRFLRFVTSICFKLRNGHIPGGIIETCQNVFIAIRTVDVANWRCLPMMRGRVDSSSRRRMEFPLPWQRNCTRSRCVELSAANEEQANPSARHESTGISPSSGHSACAKAFHRAAGCWHSAGRSLPRFCRPVRQSQCTYSNNEGVDSSASRPLACRVDRVIPFAGDMYVHQL